MSPHKISPQIPWTRVSSPRKPMWTLGSRLGKEDAEGRWGEWHPGKVAACGRGYTIIDSFFSSVRHLIYYKQWCSEYLCKHILR